MCGADLALEKWFADAVVGGSWGLFCPECCEEGGAEFRIGRGQKYDSKTLLLIEGDKQFSIEPVTVKRRCSWCKKIINIPLDATEYARYVVSNQPIQQAMPSLTAEWREMFVSGTCPTCWKRIFEPQS